MKTQCLDYEACQRVEQYLQQLLAPTGSALVRRRAKDTGSALYVTIIVTLGCETLDVDIRIPKGKDPESYLMKYAWTLIRKNMASM